MRRLTWLHAGLIGVILLGACQDATEDASEDPSVGDEDIGDEGTGEEATGPAPDKLVWAEPDLGAPAGWSIETDGAFILTRTGIGEPLLRVDFDGQIQPSLAESWERIDELSWRFVLREGVEFQDGEALTAEAVAGALTYLLERPVPARGFSPDIVESVETEDERTVIVRTVEADELLPLRLTSPNTSIFSPNAYSDAATIDPMATGTGPFVLEEQVREEFLELVANENYWGGDVNVSAVQYQLIPDGDVRAGMAQSGEAHIVRYLPIPSLPVVTAAGGVEVVSAPEARTETLLLNNESPILEDLRVRQAILHAIDREALADSVLEGAAVAAVGPFPEWQPWADPGGLTAYDHDPERARELLSEAGYEEGELSLRLWTYPGRDYLPDLGVAIQGMLTEVGVSAEVRVADYVAIEPDVLAGDYDMFILSRGHLVDVYDPLAFLSADYTCDGGYALSHHCDDELDQLIDEAAGTEDEEARWDLYRDAAEILQANAVNGFLVHVDQVHAISDSLQGFQVHPVGHYLLTHELSW